MRYLVFALALLAAAATSARAQDAIPDLKGTWSGKGKSIVFGTNRHHPGSQTPADPPRVRFAVAGGSANARFISTGTKPLAER
jgi:hypothetical protein